jgi:hypothetical protein
MELGTITQIRELRDSIREKSKSIDKSLYSTDTTYGGENEYTFKGLIGGIDAILTDISTLTKASNKFVKISTHTERNQIIQHLTGIDTYFETPPNYLPQFEALKILLRNYNVRNFSERQLQFESELEKVLKIKLQLQEELVEVNKIKNEIDESNSSVNETFDSSNEKLTNISTELDAIIEKKDELVKQSESLEEINTEILSVKNEADEQLEGIKASMSESKSNEKLITSFANKVQERDKRFTELEQKTEENNTKLDEYEKERKSILDEAETLINSARQALNYKSAEGISAAFQEQYDIAKNPKTLKNWVRGAVSFLVVTLLLGIWVVATASGEDPKLTLILGRIALLPLPILGAIFCGNQYIKQKNIIEDYAYKMVLSKAIVGFSEQLKKNGSENNEEYIHYIKTALEEIHQDPLRKREKSKPDKTGKSEAPVLKDLVEAVDKIIKMTKTE